MGAEAVTTCPACLSQPSGLSVAGCHACAVRELARGPLFFTSSRLGRITPDYRAACAALGDVAMVHAEVKACADKMALKGSA